MSEKRQKVGSSKFDSLRPEEIGEILNFVNDPQVISSLCLTSKSLSQFFGMENVYNKCKNIVFKIKSTNKIIRHYVTHLELLLYSYSYLLSIEDYEMTIEYKYRTIYFDHFPGLVHLDISFAERYNKFDHNYTDINEITFPETIQTLKIYEFPDIYWDSINKLPKNLESLTIIPYINELRNIYTNHLHGVTNWILPSTLKKLKLPNTKCYDALRNTRLPPTLEIIDLSGTYIPYEFIVRLNSLPNPLELYLRNIHKLNPGDYTEIRFSESLKVLDLSDNIMTFSQIIKLQYPRGLTNLNLSRNRFSGGLPLQFFNMAMYISDFNLPAGLKILNLSTNNFNYYDLQEKIISLVNLEELDLSFTHGIIDTLSNRVCMFPPKLKKLNLMESKIILNQDLSEKIHFPESLLVLNMSANQIIFSEFNKLKLPQGLKKLDLSWTRMSDKDLEELNIPKSLIKLILWGNNITKRTPNLEQKLQIECRSLHVTWIL